MCIYVIRGDAPKNLPVITPRGSFWCTGTTKFLATVSDNEKGKTRNVCNQAGFESVGLIPIRRNETIIGLLHLADRHENKIPKETMEVLEDCSQVLGEVIQRMLAEAVIRAGGPGTGARFPGGQRDLGMN
jgi:GAF domain-containing protein